MTKVAHLLIWLIILLVVIIGYAFRHELEYIKTRTLAVLMPSYQWQSASKELVISRSNDGHFYLDAIINDQKIKFLIDTGASDLALSKKDALSLKIDLSKLKYTKAYYTANGRISAAPILLKKIVINSKAFYNVEGNIGNGALEVSLLGMRLINSFQSFKIDKDILIIRP